MHASLAPRLVSSYTPPAPTWTVSTAADGYPIVRSWFCIVRPTECLSPVTAEVDLARCHARAVALAATLNRLYTREIS